MERERHRLTENEREKKKKVSNFFDSQVWWSNVRVALIDGGQRMSGASVSGHPGTADPDSLQDAPVVANVDLNCAGLISEGSRRCGWWMQP
ncbi:hypothetical protein ElyMa_001807000 [Elysia marginata]|uniref:Uncharacterized protein n=1 Tax=Elysia marginata TaxID=1093978 RepID=A0AAV4EH32_9GAST|nr:hypothetical protein ElyMa_001807000 [Elysia marginata]